MPTLKQQKANRKKWVKALRSGEFKQTKDKLKSLRDSYCCLGVLAELAGCSWELNEYEGGYDADGVWGEAPERAMQFVGLATSCGIFGDETLTGLNDAGERFGTIADIIESEPAGLFTA